MSRRSRSHLAALILLAALPLAGCGVLDKSDSGTKSTPTPGSAGGAAGNAKASGGEGSNGPLPDICTLLSKDDVTGLTHQQVTIMTNEGGNSPNARYCQWQLTQGQLDVTVNVDTRESFDVRNKQSTPVSGVGEAAYSLSGHLYIFQTGRVVDVYATSADSDQANLDVEKQTAAKVLPKLNS